MNDILLSSDFTIRRDLISGYEYALLPFYILILYFATRIIIWKFYQNTPYKKYILPAAFFKVFGGIFICIVYNYYYQGGDTATYYVDANNLTKIILQEPLAGMRILFSSAGHFPEEYKHVLSNFNYLNTEDTFMVVRITTIIQLFAFNSFLLTSVIFGYLSFWAIWQLYTLFAKLYPSLYNYLAYSILFIPSVLAWGSGILKDTITLSALSLFVVIAHKLIATNKISLRGFVVLLISLILLVMIKIYILIAVVPALSLFKMRMIQSSIKSRTVTVLITLLFFISIIVLGLLTATRISNYSYSILEKSRIQREYLYSISKEMGSGYSLGSINNSAVDMLMNFPAAVNVTFFRPYIWESYNVIMFMSSIESLAVFLITIYCLTKYGFFNSFKIIKNDSTIAFCLTFAILFGFFVGISTYNFGSLVRYKIPALPFYLSAMVIIYHKKKINFFKRY